MPKMDFDDSALTRASTPTAAPAPTPAPAPSRTSHFRPLAKVDGEANDFLTAARAPSTPLLRDTRLSDRDVYFAPIEVGPDMDDDSQFHGWGDLDTDRPAAKPSPTRPKPRSASATAQVPDFEPPVDLRSTAPGTRRPAETTKSRASVLAFEEIPEPAAPPRSRPGAKTRPTREPVELSTPTQPIVSAEGLSKTYGKGDGKVEALRGLDVEFGRGTFTVIMGPSGSGKSTLLHLLAGLDNPSTGSITVNGKEISKLKKRDQTKFRRASVAFIFQTNNLLPILTAEENILLPLRIAKKKVSASWVEKVIENLNLDERLRHKPDQLTPSQQQRVSVARGLVTKPAVLFADEPTGNLDSAGALDVLAFLKEAVDEMHQTILMVTHDPVAASYADRVLFLEDGRFAAELARPSLSQIIDTMRNLSQGV